MEVRGGVFKKKLLKFKILFLFVFCEFLLIFLFKKKKELFIKFVMLDEFMKEKFLMDKDLNVKLEKLVVNLFLDFVLMEDIVSFKNFYIGRY